MNIETLNAETIVAALDKARRINAYRWQACCPAHDDRSPSFSVRQEGDRVLFKCHAGCTQGEVIEALRDRGVWPQRRDPANLFNNPPPEEMGPFCEAHHTMARRGIPTSTQHKARYRHYRRLLSAPFAPGELVEMHLFCLLYKADRHYGKPSTPEDDAKFIAFSEVIYRKGVPHECR